MKKMNIYTVYVDSGSDCMKITVPAESKKAAEDYVKGNGEIIRTKQNSAENGDLIDIDLNFLTDSLRRCAWGQEEIDVITRALSQCGLDR